MKPVVSDIRTWARFLHPKRASIPRPCRVLLQLASFTTLRVLKHMHMTKIEERHIKVPMNKAASLPRWSRRGRHSTFTARHEDRKATERVSLIPPSVE